MMGDEIENLSVEELRAQLYYLEVCDRARCNVLAELVTSGEMSLELRKRIVSATAERVAEELEKVKRA